MEPGKGEWRAVMTGYDPCHVSSADFVTRLTHAFDPVHCR